MSQPERHVAFSLDGGSPVNCDWLGGGRGEDESHVPGEAREVPLTFRLPKLFRRKIVDIRQLDWMKSY
ncbi:hypothetical protein Pmani_033343 [Petrolisthes manimaculis]|uniref:Uncharacterized protein n=1 Tax=Petrolisthes manimaculis TaxID=1843537 RepID=A0AAE1TSR3_9EUCA|nr:hypothetical protein Pmani_033343 [Petrolisthes manimaculis]